MRVVTYNVLADPLCNAFLPPTYKSEDLIFENRYPRIVKRIREMLEKNGGNTIVCLQEVDSSMSCKLQLDFQRLGYNFYYHPYGNEHNDYMGIAIALPSHLIVKSVDRFRIFSGKKWPKIEEKKSGFIDKLMAWKFSNENRNEYEAWYKMKGKFNFMLTLEIVLNTNQTVFVSTLHMPCEFKNPGIMITGTALAMQHIQKLAGSKSYILAGDFNSEPGSEVYNLLTSGICDLSSLDGLFPPEDKWEFPVCVPMLSGYKKYYGREPIYTNCSSNSYLQSTFCGTIDYIFLSKNLTVKNAIPYSSSRLLCPNASEPSDHIPIWVDIIF